MEAFDYPTDKVVTDDNKEEQTRACSLASLQG